MQLDSDVVSECIHIYTHNNENLDVWYSVCNILKMISTVFLYLLSTKVSLSVLLHAVCSVMIRLSRKVLKELQA